MIWEKLSEWFGGGAAAEFKPEWTAMIAANVPLYARLPDELKQKLHERIAAFVARTRFTACGDLELTEEMVLTVAAQACLLVLHRDGPPYPDLTDIYVYPSTFHSVQQHADATGVVTEGEVHRLGESWNTGSVVLAWDSVAQGARNVFDARNVTFHEFAHQLDHENGSTDGAPPLESREAYRSWARVFSANYADFNHLLERGRKTLIDPYGATNPAEFFAVVTETFFEKPKQLHARRPDLYEELKHYYGLDPQEWFC